MNEENEKPEFKGRDWKLEVRVCSTRKLRDDSTWSRLEPEQIEMLEEWLFEENLGYAKTVERVKKEFGIVTTVPSLARYYRRRGPERQAEQLVEAQITANGLNELPLDANGLRTATLKLVGKAALNLAGETPEEVERLAALAEVLLQAEQNDLRRGRLKLAERYFDYHATTATLKEFPEVRAYLQEIADNTNLTNDEKIKKVQAMLFEWEKAVKFRKVK